ncbi:MULTISPECIES: Rho-binding antiterminator [Thiomicrorhabdus]|uniref:Transcriptional antiterminator, Rof n=1 Tax=Thiomicrorhabdus heinhorstiae TaxID=2748010 RepID=A0ABS0BXG5_9GAMM|nr:MULTISPECIES: Rho-binding antiterminator [Thiomicrorhabdus]MBF6058482.1 hypothetical protein [Thiomicrorhabdus heinhorstiae]
MPISCHLYDQLEIAAMHKRKLKLVFKDPNHPFHNRIVSVQDLQTRNSQEYALTENGETIALEGLDRLETVS